MVAQKKGRGAKNQTPVKAKPASQPEEVPEEVPEAMQAEDNNGDSQPEPTEEAAATGEAAEAPAEGDAPDDTAETKPEEQKEEKVESGKLLVENLPSSYLFDYQEKLKELFSKHGEVTSIKRGPIIVTELTTTPTLSAIVEFKNKDSLDKALTEDGKVLDGSAISVSVESRAETAVLVGVPYEASTDYVRRLFAHCGEVAHIHEFSKTKYKILRVTFQAREGVERALKLDRELRINGFLVTVSKFRDEDEQKAHSASANKNKRQHGQQHSRLAPLGGASSNSAIAVRSNNYRPRGGGSFNTRGGNFRGGSRGRGFVARGGGGGTFPRGGFAPVNNYMPPQGFMGRPGGYMNDGQRPNKRLRQM